MPELPEVETVMRGLESHLTGHKIADVTLRRAALRKPIPPDLPHRLSGARIMGFRRRGKFILMRLETGWSLLIHLGMSGRILLDKPEALHEHLTLKTTEGHRMGFVDPRRFGLLDLVRTDAEDETPWLCKMGPEPLGNSFSGATLQAACAGKTAPIKAVLLDQHVVAGIGNIYASEALFRAGISPLRAAGKISAPKLEKLAQEVRHTLQDAIKAGGSSLRDYVQPSGELGYFQHAWKVYGRAGAPCEQCPGVPPCTGIKQVTQAGRSSFYCPKTQR